MVYNGTCTRNSDTYGDTYGIEALLVVLVELVVGVMAFVVGVMALLGAIVLLVLIVVSVEALE